MGSTGIQFIPQESFQGGKVECGGKTAQSTSLILQCLLPILVFAPQKSELTIKGGTTVSKSPPTDSVKLCLLDLLRMMNIKIEYNCIKQGYFPEGRGIVKVNVEPTKLKSIQLLEKNKILEGYIKMYVTQEQSYKDSIKSIQKTVEQFEKNKINYQIDSEIIRCKKFREIYDLGINCLLKSEINFYDCSHICMDDQSLNQVIDIVNEKIVKELSQDSCLDEFHQDQLLIYMALASGQSAIKVGLNITPHTKAAIYVLKQFIPELEIKIEQLEQTHIISVNGIAL